MAIDPLRPLTNYKLLDDIAAELAGKMKIQELQEQLAKVWKPWMKDLDTMYTDATCYESEMQNPDEEDPMAGGSSGQDHSFGTQKEHYSMRRINAMMKMTEIMNIFFGIHTTNVMNLAATLLATG